uniref:Putative secreted protein n=1 Tax=Ixodes scapularis TaxID=6945 RepID=A0A4D5REW3_IXOSC
MCLHNFLALFFSVAAGRQERRFGCEIVFRLCNNFFAMSIIAIRCALPPLLMPHISHASLFFRGYSINYYITQGTALFCSCSPMWKGHKGSGLAVFSYHRPLGNRNFSLFGHH